MKVAIYCRLSEEDKNKSNEYDDSESIQNQKTMLIEYAMKQQWEIFNIYSDDDYTGADRNRPAFNQLLKDAEARKFNIVLCKTQSRFTRELELVEKYLHGLFPLWNIRFISIVDNADTENKGNKKSRQINGLVNEWYLEDMSDSIKSVFASKQRNGVYIGSFPLYGYVKDPEQKGHLIIDEPAAEIVREIFRLYADGYGKVAIATILNRRNIPNPTEYKRLHNIQKPYKGKTNNTLWRYSTISSMLRNEMYIGNMIQSRFGSISYKTKQNLRKPKDQWVKVENTHEAIISIELWNRVQELIHQNAKSSTAGTIGLFAKKVKCSSCGYALRSCQKDNGKTYLRCSTRIISIDKCEGASIKVDDLEQKILMELKRMNAENIDMEYLTKNVSLINDYQNQYDELTANLQDLSKKISACSGAIKSLYFDKVKGLITDDEFVEYSKDFHNDKEKYEALYKDFSAKLDELEKRKQMADNRREIIESYVNIDHLTHEIVDTLIDCIYVGKKDPETKEIPIEIHWNF